MSEAGTVYRLISAFGTRLYVDPDGRMRHGAVGEVAENVWATMTGTALGLFFYAPEHGTHPFSILQPDSGGEGPAVVFGASQTFDVVPAAAAVGLVSGGKYLCCEPHTGQVVLNRDLLGAWEEITLVEAETAPIADPLEASIIASEAVPEVLSPTQDPPAVYAEPPPGPAERPPEPQPAFARLAASRHTADASDEVTPAYAGPEATPAPEGLWRRLRRSLLGS